MITGGSATTNVNMMHDEVNWIYRTPAVGSWKEVKRGDHLDGVVVGSKPEEDGSFSNVLELPWNSRCVLVVFGFLWLPRTLFKSLGTCIFLLTTFVFLHLSSHHTITAQFFYSACPPRNSCPCKVISSSFHLNNLFSLFVFLMFRKFIRF